MSTSENDWDPGYWMERCAWCEEPIPEGHEVFGISMKFRPGMADPAWAGTVQPMHLFLRQRTIPMMVVGEDSPAKRQGNDGMFQVCSDSCGRELQQALGEEMVLGDAISPPERED